MPILSVSEFEAVMTQVVNRIEKEFVARGRIQPLETARDDLARILSSARDGRKLKASRAKLDSVSDAMTGEIKDEQVMNQLGDLLDYIDYRA